MGVLEAVKHNIEYRSTGRVVFYKVNCNECGDIFEHNRFNPKHAHEYLCPKCKDIAKVADDLYLRSKKEKKFEAAVERISRMTKLTPKYKKAIEIVHKNLHRKGWFQSTEEIMVAIELLKNDVKAIHQQKVKQYKVDFVLPDMKVLLEIDGQIYHGDLRKEGNRDGNIVLAMGLDWHVVRITTEKVNKDITKLMKAIKTIKEHKDNPMHEDFKNKPKYKEYREIR